LNGEILEYGVGLRRGVEGMKGVGDVYREKKGECVRMEGGGELMRGCGV
jgi:hypothetical protein